MRRNDLFAKIESVKLEDLISDWRWLVKDKVTLVVITAMGDLILKNKKDEIYFLDTIDGKYFKIANNKEEYQELLKDKHFRRNYLKYFSVLNLMNEGKTLKTNQCYSPDIPPCLGGEFDEDNFQPTDIYVHFSMSGQIWNQCKDLKPGTKIDKVIIKDSNKGFFSKLIEFLKTIKNSKK